MRIAGGTVVRRYIGHLERNYSNKNKSENKIISNRQYNRASENPIKAAKAMKVRKAMSDITDYQANLSSAKAIYDAAESSVMKVSELMQSTYEKLIYAANGTQGSDEDEILSETIGTYADEMLRLSNLVVADNRIFGGTNNSTNAFEVKNFGDYKSVYYNGKPVDEISDPTMFPNSKSSYTDIGIGMAQGADGTIHDQTALKITFNGAEILGCGLKGSFATFNLDDIVPGGQYMIDVTLKPGETKRIAFEGGVDQEDTANILTEKFAELYGSDKVKIDPESGIVTNLVSDNIVIENTDVSKLRDENGQKLDPNDYETFEYNINPTGYAKNIIQLTLDAAECVKSGDKLAMAKFADQIFESQTYISLSIANLGNTEEFIDFNVDRLTNNMYSLQEQQNDLEGTDLGTEMTNFKVMESILNATLQMSTSIIPQSIFQFIR